MTTYQDFGSNANNNNNMMQMAFSPTNAFPRGGTGDTNDSFASSFKPPQSQHAGFSGFGNPNFSAMAQTANSF